MHAQIDLSFRLHALEEQQSLKHNLSMLGPKSPGYAVIKLRDELPAFASQWNVPPNSLIYRLASSHEFGPQGISSLTFFLMADSGLNSPQYESSLGLVTETRTRGVVRLAHKQASVIAQSQVIINLQQHLNYAQVGAVCQNIKSLQISVSDIQVFSYRSGVRVALFELTGPEGEVVPDQLHDGGGIFVLLLVDLLDVANSVIEGLLGQLAGLGGVVHHLVVEHRVVEGQAESDGVGGLELGSLLKSLLVGLAGLVPGPLVVVPGGVLRDVPEVVSLHLVVEDLGLGCSGRGDKALVEQQEDVVAEAVQLDLDLLLVLLEEVEVLRVLGLLLLLDGADGPPGGPPGADRVLVGNREQVALLDGELAALLDYLLHVVEHVLEPFGLFANLGEVDQLVALHPEQIQIPPPLFIAPTFNYSHPFHSMPRCHPVNQPLCRSLSPSFSSPSRLQSGPPHRHKTTPSLFNFAPYANRKIPKKGKRAIQPSQRQLICFWRLLFCPAIFCARSVGF